jgi:hypothetical protein
MFYITEVIFHIRGATLAFKMFLNPLEGASQLFMCALMVRAQFFGATFLKVSCFSAMKIFAPRVFFSSFWL